jgi:hypothetical protein
MVRANGSQGANREFTVFRDLEGYQMVIDHLQAEATEAEVLQRYQVPNPYSPDLAP